MADDAMQRILKDGDPSSAFKKAKRCARVRGSWPGSGAARNAVGARNSISKSMQRS
jgi:hypothetical protein